MGPDELQQALDELAEAERRLAMRDSLRQTRHLVVPANEECAAELAAVNAAAARVNAAAARLTQELVVELVRR